MLLVDLRLSHGPLDILLLRNKIPVLAFYTGNISMKLMCFLTRKTASSNRGVVQTWKIFKYVIFNQFGWHTKPQHFCLLIQEVISSAVKSVLKESPELKYLRVVSSYKRFDPTRGMDYRLHLLFSDPIKGKMTIRYLHSNALVTLNDDMICLVKDGRL